jgi:hypothetical protein
MDEVDEREKQLEEEISLLQRFRKQNVRAMNVIDDTFKSPVAAKGVNIITKETGGVGGGDGDGEDASSAWMSGYDELLERLPFKTNEENIESEPLVKTVDLFLNKWYVKHGSVDIGLLPLSLSGGVDSMVLLKVMTERERDSSTFFCAHLMCVFVFGALVC